MAKIQPICAAGEAEHVAEVEREQRQPRSPDQVLEEHHHGEARRGGGHDWRCTIVHPMAGRLGVGFIGSGFMTRFHIRSWEAVRDADIRGIYSPTRANAEDAAALARSLRVGDAKAFGSIEAMVADESIDCIWLCGPNFARVENMERIVAAIKKGAKLQGDRVREAAGAQRRRSRAHGASSSKKPACCTAISRTSCSRRVSSAASRSSGRAAPQRRGPPVSGARGRRARRSAHAVVLAGRSAGRRRPERHDVPQPRSRPLPADQARRAARQHPAGQGVGADRVAEVVASRLREAAARHHDRQGRLRQASRPKISRAPA